MRNVGLVWVGGYRWVGEVGEVDKVVRVDMGEKVRR